MKKSIFLGVFISVGLILSSPAAQAQDGAPTTVSLAMAETIIDAAKAKAEQEGWKMSFAVVDSFGRPVAMVRWMTPKVAHGKALTSATFGRPSATVEEFTKNRPQLFKNVQKMIGESLLPAGGGLPIEVDGKLLGGIGASGGTEAEDIEAAQAGLDALRAQ
ncbi:MAG: heme-binding protein [Desulfurellaceae bacterium]|nr:heme-binding protein [Desulfurellaceae bacterium]